MFFYYMTIYGKGKHIAFPKLDFLKVGNIFTIYNSSWRFLISGKLTSFQVFSLITWNKNYVEQCSSAQHMVCDKSITSGYLM